MKDVPENIDPRLALGSGPTTDGDVSSNVQVWVRSDQEEWVTVCTAPQRGGESACPSCVGTH